MQSYPHPHPPPLDLPYPRRSPETSQCANAFLCVPTRYNVCSTAVKIKFLFFLLSFPTTALTCLLFVYCITTSTCYTTARALTFRTRFCFLSILLSVEFSEVQLSFRHRDTGPRRGTVCLKLFKMIFSTQYRQTDGMKHIDVKNLSFVFVFMELKPKWLYTELRAITYSFKLEIIWFTHVLPVYCRIVHRFLLDFSTFLC